MRITQMDFTEIGVEFMSVPSTQNASPPSHRACHIHRERTREKLRKGFKYLPFALSCMVYTWLFIHGQYLGRTVVS